MLQRRIWVKGKHSSKLRLKNVSFFFCCVLMFLPGVVSAAIAETTLTVKLPKVPPTFKTARVSVTSVEAETANLLASVVLNTKSKKVQLKVKTVPQIIFADLSSSDGNELGAHSHVLRPVDGKKMNVTLQLESGISEAFSEETDLSHGLSSHSADTAWPPVGIDLIGVPSSGFTVEGPGPSPRDIANMVITDLSQAFCYGEGGGFEVVETDPDKLAIRKAEIDLSNSTWGDPSTRLQDLYVPPSMVINGNWTSDGTSLTVTVTLVDSQGRQLLSKSATGPVDSWSDLNRQVMNELIDAMCEPKNACADVTAVKAWTGTIVFSYRHSASNGDFQIDLEHSANVSVRLEKFDEGPGGISFLGQASGTAIINDRQTFLETPPKVTTIQGSGTPIHELYGEKLSEAVLNINLMTCEYNFGYTATINVMTNSGSAPIEVGAVRGWNRPINSALGENMTLSATASFPAHSGPWGLQNDGDAYFPGGYGLMMFFLGIEKEDQAGTATVTWTFTAD